MRGRLWGIAILAACSAATAPAMAAQHEQGGYRFAVEPTPTWVDSAPAPATWPGDFPTDGSSVRIWLVDRQVDRRQGRNRAYFRTEIEPLSTAVLQDAAQLSAAYDPAYQRLVIHEVSVVRDGRTIDRLDPGRITLTRREQQFEASIYDGQVSALLVLEDVRVGDRIRFAWSVEGGNPVLAGLEGEHFYLGWMDPILNRRVRVWFDGDAKVDARALGPGAVAARIERSAGSLLVAWDGERIVPTRSVDGVPAWFRPMGELYVAPRQGWADVVAWALPLYPQVTLGAEARQLAAQWRQLPTPALRAEAALRFVQDEVRYFGVELGESSHRPHAPDEVLARRYGDCKDKSRLLVELLRAMDMEAVPALVSAARGRAIAEEPPSNSAFDHVIVRLRIGGHTYWVDPTDSLQRGGLELAGPPELGVALPVAAGVVQLETIERPSDYRNGGVIAEHLRLGTDGTAQLEVETRWNGALAEVMRRQIATMGLERLGADWLDAYSRLYGGATQTRPPTVADDPEHNALNIVESYQLREPFGTAGLGRRTLDLHSIDLAQLVPLPDQIERTAPLAQWYPLSARHSVNVTLAPGQSALLAPERIEVDDPALHYVRVIESKPGEIRIEHSIETRADFVGSERLRDHLDALGRTHDALSYRVVLKGDAGSRSDRAARLRKLLQSPAESAPER